MYGSRMVLAQASPHKDCFIVVTVSQIWDIAKLLKPVKATTVSCWDVQPSSIPGLCKGLNEYSKVPVIVKSKLTSEVTN